MRLGADNKSPKERGDALWAPAFPVGKVRTCVLRFRATRVLVKLAPWVVAIGGALTMDYFLFFLTIPLFGGEPEAAVPWVSSVGLGLGYIWRKRVLNWA